MPAEKKVRKEDPTNRETRILRLNFVVSSGSGFSYIFFFLFGARVFFACLVAAGYLEYSLHFPAHWRKTIFGWIGKGGEDPQDACVDTPDCKYI